MDRTVDGLSSLQDGGPTLANHPVRIFPSTDTLFHAAVLAALEGLPDRGAEPTTAIEERLRPDYPAVHVVRQHALGAIYDEPALYVFRDGSLLPQRGDGPGSPMYLGPLVRGQRLSVRSAAVRRRSALLLAVADEVVQRSRSLRKMVGARREEPSAE